MSIDNTLNERGARYGDFTDHARICQGLKRHMMSQAGWGRLEDVHKQALDVIADKIARILSGDPNYADNWHDIQGYAKLVEDRLDLFSKQPQRAKTPEEIAEVGRVVNIGEALNAMGKGEQAKRRAEDAGVEAAIKSLDDDIRAKLGLRRESTEKDDCNCPACNFRRALEQALGGDVEVEIMRFDPDLGKSGPLKH